jgi:hypothetical protein
VLGYTSMYNLSEEDQLQIAYFDKNLFVVSRFGYSYTGGAHGNYGTGFSVYDLKNKERLKLSDVLTEAGIKILPEILEKNFRKQYKVEDTQSLSEYGLFDDTIHVNENFILTPGCMVFDYVPYEIGPYAAGEIKIYIPMIDIDKYLQPRIIKLFM